MIRRDIPPISAHAQRMSMLATLDHDEALSVVGKKAREQDIGWIEAAMDAGAFDPSGDVFRGLSPTKDTTQSSDMLEALTQLTQETVTTQGDQDPVYGRLGEPTTLLELHSTDPFRNTYQAVVERWVNDTATLIAKLDRDASRVAQQVAGDLDDQFNRMAMKLMVTAIAIDTPDVLETLIKARPDALLMTLDPNKVADRVMESTIENSELELTPYGFALQYGKVEAMAVIEAALPKAGPMVGAVNVLGGQQPLNAAQLHDYLTPLCYPSVYADAIKLCFDRDPELDNSEVVGAAVTAIGLESELKRYQMWPAYVALDLYRHDAATAFEEAVTHGHLAVVKSFEGNVPWAEMDTDPNSSVLIRVLNEQNKISTQRHHHDAVETMVKMAKADGALDGVLRIVAQPDIKGVNGGDCAIGPVCVAPIAHLIEFEYQDVLHELLRHSGLKPIDPPVPGAWTLQKMGDARSDVIADFFRSYSARGRAHDLIDEISSPKHTASAP